MTCVECAGQLPPPAATGRPRSYCGDVCRRSAEYRLARSRRLAEALERRLVNARIELACESSQHRRGDVRTRIKAITKELVAAEGRLVELMRSRASEQENI
jgi:hypothetical protein